MAQVDVTILLYRSYGLSEWHSGHAHHLQTFVVEPACPEWPYPKPTPASSPLHLAHQRTVQTFQRRFPLSRFALFGGCPFEEFAFEQIFGGEVELIFLGVDVGFLGEGEFYDGFVLLPAQQQADGGIFFW